MFVMNEKTGNLKKEKNILQLKNRVPEVKNLLAGRKQPVMNSGMKTVKIIYSEEDREKYIYFFK